MVRLARLVCFVPLAFVLLGCTPPGNAPPKQPSESNDSPAAGGLDSTKTGYYEVKGSKTVGGTPYKLDNAGYRRGDKGGPIEVDPWPVTKEEFSKLNLKQAYAVGLLAIST